MIFSEDEFTVLRTIKALVDLRKYSALRWGALEQTPA
jgi:hypothetical protein